MGRQSREPSVDVVSPEFHMYTHSQLLDRALVLSGELKAGGNSICLHQATLEVFNFLCLLLL
jgi:hypothetical protein